MDEERLLVTEERFPRAWCAKGLDWTRGSGGKAKPKPRHWVSFEGLEGFGLLTCLPASFDAKEIIS
jgi:hypothetical protein